MSIELGMPGYGAPPFKEVSCATCPAPCCGEGMAIALSEAEASFMEHSGTQLLETPGEPLSTMQRLLARAGVITPKKVYTLAGDCGYLRRNESGAATCTAYEARPQACGDFRMGGEPCRYVRMQRGIDTQEEFDDYWTISSRQS